MSIKRACPSLALAASLLAGPVAAESMLLSVSPIPDGAEERFCYYGGLAYSESAYVLLEGSSTVTTSIEDRQQRLLECVRDDEGKLVWVGRANIQMGR
ncbi:hypothetical protein [Oceanomicrobium pacificus]|uniref:Uncharacterized protein n=1 Tax=Oceanomicrobium pacificus TaxID=2692916 RepID=A0A6B0TZK9_9RHOB|nr:hypothetical protein [Oceanomicrobium pacificus]MXU66443.1 hypothetical protein [Oceanomicrobium pacificus]